MSNPLKDQYKAFCEWCYENPSFDLDPRLQQHSGPIEHGGYIADTKTATAFAAWKAALVQQPAPAAPVAFFWEDTDPRVEGRRYGPYFGWPTEEALARVGDSAKPIPLYAAPPTTAPDTVAVPRELYTCVGKGGEYELLGRSLGAGERRLDRVVVYRDTETGLLYHRTLDDFEARMAMLEGGAE